jgi:hypothetical protein
VLSHSNSINVIISLYVNFSTLPTHVTWTGIQLTRNSTLYVEVKGTNIAPFLKSNGPRLRSGHAT